MRKFSTFQITLMSLLIALLVIQTYVPITIFPGAPTITVGHIIVAIGAILLGPSGGLVLGTVWGGLSLLRAFTAPPSPLSVLLFTNPVIALVPRMVVGWSVGWLYQKFQKRIRIPALLASITAFIGTFLNTGLVVLFTYLFFVKNPTILLRDFGQASSTTGLFWLITIMLGANFITEAVTAVVLTPLVVTPMQRIVSRRHK
ncbi:ECF transporter S component [Schleiferilactobacillus perolens]|uniref:Integral membrane protein n=1 Tax=Schleiferilactobacillus perolens DSM 12744 TaxID=1423792 RepID=A0A0R1MVF6_9LACO|nr:ECF transporter S component [Schleiferilactobacillus perolens]KRL12222.1 hypothetical protein FD09_GL003092 [Schleiferilactobacillus perolens DSM 12744]